MTKKAGRKKATRKGARRAGAAEAHKTPRVSLRAFARAIGVSHTAVQRAISSGRLRSGVGRDARGPNISDVELARREWSAASPLDHARREVAQERAKGLRLANRLKEGELVPAADVKRQTLEASTIVCNAMRALPDRLAAELAGEDNAERVHARLSDEIGKALGMVAESLGGARGVA